MKKQICWGIIGTGDIASQFAEDLQYVKDAKILAVGSRARRTAELFARRFSVPRHYSSYESIAKDPDIDVVYIATPHTYHMKNTILCLESGKNVLCEKPLGINANQVREMIDCAKKNNLFLMEALWSRFFPALQTVQTFVRSEEIGKCKLLTADFGFQADYNPNNRLFNPELVGGALLDVGIYPVSLALQLFGNPKKFTSLASMTKTGVDEQSGLIFQFDNGQLAVLHCSFCVQTSHTASVYGTKGHIEIGPPWYKPGKLTILNGNKDLRTINLPFQGNGYHFEAAEIVCCLKNKKTESSIMPLSESLRIINVLDRIRSRWGLRYPNE